MHQCCNLATTHSVPTRWQESESTLLTTIQGYPFQFAKVKFHLRKYRSHFYIYHSVSWHYQPWSSMKDMNANEMHPQSVHCICAVDLYTTKLLFHQSPTRHGDYMVNGQSVVTVANWHDDYAVTVQSPCCHHVLQQVTDGIGVLLCMHCHAHCILLKSD